MLCPSGARHIYYCVIYTTADGSLVKRSIIPPAFTRAYHQMSISSVLDMSPSGITHYPSGGGDN
eukprot:1186083-Pleurochrysis_carterae.AAC.1